MIQSLNGKTPRVEKASFVAWNAQVIGDVELGEGVSIWYSATVRGDNDCIRIGNRSNIQDNAVLHVDHGVPLTIGDGVTVGHGAILHGCTVEDDCLIGMGAIILNGAKISKGSVVGAGALVTENKEFPPDSLIVGSPAKAIRKLSEEHGDMIRNNAGHYVENGATHRDTAVELE